MEFLKVSQSPRISRMKKTRREEPLALLVSTIYYIMTETTFLLKFRDSRSLDNVMRDRVECFWKVKKNGFGKYVLINFLRMLANKDVSICSRIYTEAKLYRICEV